MCWTTAGRSTSCSRTDATGEIYNIGSGVEKTNLAITDQVLALLGKDAVLDRVCAGPAGA